MQRSHAMLRQRPSAPEHDVRIMPLWAGLLSVNAELSRRLALYAALLPDEKTAYFDQVTKAYAVRSRAVHGGGLNKPKPEERYRTAGGILTGLIARCVELGCVPSAFELDRPPYHRTSHRIDGGHYGGHEDRVATKVVGLFIKLAELSV